jgi:integrase
VTWNVVSDKKGNRIPHLVLRDGRYYLDITIRKKRYLRRIQQETLGDARATAAAMIRALRVAPESVAKLREESPSISALVNHYRTAAEYRRAENESPSIRSSENCIGALMLVLRQGLNVENPEKQNCSVLNEDLIHRYIKARVDSAGTDLIARQRARLSASSTVNQARALFARWAQDYYRKRIHINVETFLKCSGAERVTKKYQRPPEELIIATQTAAEALRQDNPPLYSCFLLTYNMGLRAGECANLQWSWFFQDNGRRFLRLERRSEWKAKGRSHTIAVSQSTWEYLQAHKTDPIYVLPGTGPTVRRDLVGRTFATWIRSIGWDRAKYPKAAHELRKLFGSEVYGKYGSDWAAEWLGHTDTRTTRTFYADPAPASHPQPMSVTD